MSHENELKRKSAKKLKEIRMETFPDMDHTCMDYVTNIVCEVFRVKKEEVIKRNNMREYVEARQTIMYLAVMEEKLALWYIGAYLDWRDHSTVIYGRDIVQGTLMGVREYLKKFNEVKNKIKMLEQVKTLEDLNTLC